MPAPPFFYRETLGIRITVRPRYVGEQSMPAAGRFVFAYAVRIENVGTEAAQLITRQWRIHDSIGEELEVAGDGVVGQQPMLAPGEVHEYGSFCILKAPSGYMEGSYHFVRADGTEFDALVPRFHFAVNSTTEP